jgi:hypothetical protein
MFVSIVTVESFAAMRTPNPSVRASPVSLSDMNLYVLPKPEANN